VTGILRQHVAGGQAFNASYPEVVRQVGLTSATVWSLIEFRCRVESQTQDGYWRCSMEDMACQIGITRKQVQRAVNHLLDEGYLERTTQHGGGVYDQTKSYKVVWADTPEPSGTSENSDVTKRANQWPKRAYAEDRPWPKRSNVHWPKRSDVPTRSTESFKQAVGRSAPKSQGIGCADQDTVPPVSVDTQTSTLGMTTTPRTRAEIDEIKRKILSGRIR
jgi:hypothetical protein